MARDSFTETTHTGWLSRLGSSISGMFIGAVLLLVSIVLLWWNEGRSVTTARGLAEGAELTVEAQAESVNPEQEGKLIHLIGKTAVTGGATDEMFKVLNADLIKLRRVVELFQWTEESKTETHNNAGGSETSTTTYSYKKEWDSKVWDSSEFHQRAGHDNPPPRLEGAHFKAQSVTLGAFRLPEFLVDQWEDFKALPLPDVKTLPAELADQANVQGEWLVLSKTPKEPALGDARVRFEAIKTGEASVLARQVRDTLEAFTTSQDTQIARITSGVKSKEAMFADAQAENTFVAWLLRGMGFVLMILGFTTLFKPLKIVADVLPLAGRLVEAGTGLIALLLSVVGSVTIIALSWLWYRPMLGIALLIVSAGGLYLLARAFKKKAAA